MFETFVGTRAGVLRVGSHVELLGLPDRRISAVHAFRNRTGDVVVLAGTYGDGMFRSLDLGKTWPPVSDGMTAPAARTVVPDPLEPGALLCGTEPARLFRGTDDGQTWVEFEGVQAIPEHREWYLPYSPRAGALRNVYAPPGGRDRLLAAVEVGGLLQTTDGGLSWSIAPIGPNEDIHQVSGHPTDPTQLWSALGYAALRPRPRGGDRPKLGGVGRSRDGGQTWEVLHTSYTRSVIVPPARPDLVLAGPAGNVGEGGELRSQPTAETPGSRRARGWRRRCVTWSSSSRQPRTARFTRSAPAAASSARRPTTGAGVRRSHRTYRATRFRSAFWRAEV